MATVVNFIDTTLQAASSRTINLPNAAVILTPSTNTFHINAAGANDPASITFAYSLVDLDGPATFSCTGGTVTTSGNVATLTYANMAGSTAIVTASITVNGTTYSASCAVSKVYDGTNGVNNCRVYAYQRAASAPTGSPGDVTVTFSTNSITSPAALLNGWLRDIPSTDGNPLYVAAISGAGTGSTIDLLSAGWSAAAVLATDGPGGTGTNGTNGLNSATITIYQRSASATALALPTAATTYTFATGVLSGLDNGWTQTYPAADSAKPYVQVSLATAVSSASTDTVAATEWSTAQLLYDASAVIAAQAAAEQAQTDANTANTTLANIASDNILSKGEKPAAILDWNVVTGELSGIQTQADNLSVSRTSYDAAYTALYDYLVSIYPSPSWSDVTVDTPIVGSTFSTKFSDYYTAKTSLLNAIAAKAATLANWSNIAGQVNAPASNASADVVLNGRNCSIYGNTVKRTTGSGAWDADAYTTDGFTGGAYITSRFTTMSGQYTMFGFCLDPFSAAATGTSRYANLLYGIFVDGTGGTKDVYIYSNGTQVASYGNIGVDGDIYGIYYDDVSFKFTRNGTVFNTITSGVASGLKLYGEVCIVTNGIAVDNVRFGPQVSNNFASVGGSTKPADNATVGATAGTNLTDSTGAVMTDAQVRNGYTENGVGHVVRPLGGSVSSGSGTVGAIEILLPAAIYYSNTMLRIRVEIYEYVTGRSCTYVLSGYNYSGAVQWYNVTAEYTGPVAGRKVVRFGNNTAATRNAIWIGETGSGWEYPKVRITEVTTGHTNYDWSTWASGWTLGFVTSFGTVNNQVDTPSVGGAMASIDSITAANVATFIEASAITDTQLAAIAAAKITGTLSDSQLATIAAAKITGTLSDSQLAAIASTKITGTLTDAQIANLAAAKVTGQIVGTQITDGAISTDKLSAGAVTANEIAANTILAKNLVLFNADAVNADSGLNDPTTWGAPSGWPANVSVASDISYPISRVLLFSIGASGINMLGSPFIVEKGASYRMRVSLWANSGTAGAFSATLHLPGVSYDAMAIPRTVANTTGYSYDIDWAAIPPNQWNTYETVVTAPSARDWLQFILSGAITAGAFYIGFQLTRAASANLIVDGAITTDKLTANAVTAAKIAANTITAGQIAANTITSSEIAADTITAANIAASAITATELATGAVIAGKIAAGTIVAGDIAALTITGTQIAANTITAAKIAVGAITANEIAANTITSAQIAAGTITATEIAASTITAGKMSVTDLSAISGNFTTLQYGTNGYLSSGMTAYLTGTGSWQGLVSGVFKASWGNSAGAYMAWNGSALVVNGATITGGSIGTSTSLPVFTLTGTLDSDTTGAVGSAQSITLTTSVSGGSGTYKYTWSFIKVSGGTSGTTVTGSGLSSSTLGLTCTPSGTTNMTVYYSATVTVVDTVLGLTKTLSGLGTFTFGTG